MLSFCPRPPLSRNGHQVRLRSRRHPCRTGFGGRSSLKGICNFVAEWTHFTRFGIILPTIKGKVYTFLGLMNSATKLERDL